MHSCWNSGVQNHHKPSVIWLTLPNDAKAGEWYLLVFLLDISAVFQGNDVGHSDSVKYFEVVSCDYKRYLWKQSPSAFVSELTT